MNKEENNIKILTVPKRKRGRPRKNELVKTGKPKIIKSIKNEEIILHMPLKMSDLKTKYLNKSETNTTKKSDKNDSVVFTLEDIDIIEPKNKSNSSNKHLLKEIKKKNEIIEDLQNKINELNNNTQSNTRKIKKMNTNCIKSIDGKIYPQKTNISCWWCTEKFDTVPIGLPTNYSNDTFSVLGVFCSFNCAAAWNAKESKYSIWDRYSLLHKLKYKIMGCNNKINIAPAKETLKKFGGYLSINEFRNKQKDKLKDFSIIIPPLISIIPFIEEDNGLYKKKTKKNKMDYLDKLKSKRKKPLPNDNYNLLHSMGIKSNN